jgi:hypothetical protein
MLKCCNVRNVRNVRNGREREGVGGWRSMSADDFNEIMQIDSKQGDVVDKVCL